MKTKVFTSFAQIEATVDTKGYEGGSNSGAHTIINLRDLGGTQWELTVDESSINGPELRIELVGDDEIKVIIDVLRWCANTLARMHREDVNRLLQRLKR